MYSLSSDWLLGFIACISEFYDLSNRSLNAVVKFLFSLSCWLTFSFYFIGNFLVSEENYVERWKGEGSEREQLFNLFVNLQENFYHGVNFL